MKKLSYLLASVMLVAMTFASCKSSNKPAADRIKAFTEKK